MVTVIIPAYGVPTFLRKSIESVINQTYSDWELIIVDDNNPGTDARTQTEKVIGAFNDNRIRYIKHQHNKNGAAARNTALREAKGEYVSFLDSDDEYMPNRLEVCVRTIEYASGNVAGVYTGCEFRRGGKTYKRFRRVKSGSFIVDTLACRFMFCTGSNIFVRREVIKHLNGFDETFIRHQDYEFLVRLFEKYSLLAIPEILVIKNNENINRPDINKMAEVKQQYLRKFKKQMDELTEGQQSYIYYANNISLAEQSLNQCNFALGSKYYRLARQSQRLTLTDNIRRLLFYIRAYIQKLK